MWAESAVCSSSQCDFRTVSAGEGVFEEKLISLMTRGISLPLKKVFDCLRPVKDDLGLKTPGLYCIPSECGKVCVGQSGRTIETRVKEH